VFKSRVERFREASKSVTNGSSCIPRELKPMVVMQSERAESSEAKHVEP
jgi:hypothetical protein